MNNSAVKWIAIIVIVVLIGLGLWWLLGQQPVGGANSSTASTTPETATSTETSGAGAITVQNSTGTVAQVVAGLALGSRYASLLSSTGVGATLTGKGPYTIFVATDGAFSRLPAGTLSAMSSADLKRLVQYSIVPGKKLDVDAVNSGQIQALSKDMINFQVDATKKAVYVNSGYVLQAYSASNGIVYVINSVLVPPTSTQ
jgi:uncharacterized surface protein with fasciclin (FAS1) repeats